MHFWRTNPNFFSPAIALLLIASHPLSAQTDSSQPSQWPTKAQQLNPGKRDLAAVAVVEQALLALGGKQAISAIQSVESTGSITKDGSGAAATFRWSVIISGNSFEFRRETDDGNTTRIFSSGHGHPGYISGGSKAKRLAPQMAVTAPPYDLPASLLYAELQNTSLTFTAANPTSDGAYRVKITNENDPILAQVLRQDWYFDQKTGLPIRVEYNLSSSVDAATTVHASCGFLDYKEQNNVRYPASLESYEEDKKVGQIAVLTMKTNSLTDPTVIDIPLEAPRSGGSSK